MQVTRLNYIGSKYQLLDWIETSILQATAWPSLQGKAIADPFAGTGIVSHFFRLKGAKTLSNDAELYSATIAKALTETIYQSSTQTLLNTLNEELQQNKYAQENGFITQHYSPNGNRLFFTLDNAKRIDYIRRRLEDLKPTQSPNDIAFALASLLIAADAVSNVPAVYGCFLKAFKAKAEKPLALKPIHQVTTPPQPGSQTTNSNALTLPLTADLVYIDPPYNERQYSKNYFPLNMIAEANPTATLSGKTGIPNTCFLSPFCQKRLVEAAFRTTLDQLNSKVVAISYSSEGLLSRQTLENILAEYGQVTVFEKQYKRFKSFEYNESATLTEFLFVIKKTLPSPP